MIESNPFQISFGSEPTNIINRLTQTEEILQSFLADNPSSQVYMITGVRGSGKTVMLSQVAHQLNDRKDWVVIELNPITDIMNALVAKLYDEPQMHKLFLDAKIDLTALGIGISIDKSLTISDTRTALERMLKELKKHNKKLLITIDEAINNEYVRVFAGDFQILMRQGYPIYLLMSGLYDNIYNLQNEDTLTFLYRAPKITLEPLNINAIANVYKGIFSISDNEAVKMAHLTKGYPFAFQVLGFLRFKYKNEKGLSELMPEYDQYLEEYVYEKIWSELSERDKEIMSFIAQNGTAKIKEIREALSIKSGDMSTYRARLYRKGLVDTSTYGSLSIILPRLSEIIQMWTME